MRLPIQLLIMFALAIATLGWVVSFGIYMMSGFAP